MYNNTCLDDSKNIRKTKNDLVPISNMYFINPPTHRSFVAT